MNPLSYIELKKKLEQIVHRLPVKVDIGLVLLENEPFCSDDADKELNDAWEEVVLASSEEALTVKEGFDDEPSPRSNPNLE